LETGIKDLDPDVMIARVREHDIYLVDNPRRHRHIDLCRIGCDISGGDYDGEGVKHEKPPVCPGKQKAAGQAASCRVNNLY
jgi:hypothetical protein